ncbi:PEGA domain-containing protein [bacterium]|nr:PEGA domain-containing protein [bacterium]
MVNLLKKPKVRIFLKKILSFVLPIFSTFFIVGTTAIIIVIINGYSIDISRREVIKTGVLNVETNPNDADISINGEYYGKSNRAVPNLKIGFYEVKLTKEGYFPYKKRIEIQHGLASPLIVPLLRTNNKKEILQLHKTSILDSNSTGYYILSDATNGPTTIEESPTPAKNTTRGTATYTLSKIYVTKPLFDDPHPVLDEKMTITALSATPISAISVSPTGKILYVTLTDKSGNKSISLIPFKRNTTVNANLTDARSLTNYAKDKSTKFSWSKDGDYLIVETDTQIISYNVKAGTRVILMEKSETQNTQLIWNLTDTGIVVIKRTQGTSTNTYEIVDISYNGNPLSAQLPTVTIDSAPTRIWSYSTSDTPRFIIATNTGTYLLGKLYDAKSSDMEITLTNEKIADIAIEHFGEDFSRVKISSEEILLKPMYSEEKNLFSFTENKNQNLIVFYYNKRIADHLTLLGRKQIYISDHALEAPTSLADSAYVATKQEATLRVTDTTGENSMIIQSNIKTFSVGPNDIAILFTDDSSKLWFSVLR